MVSSVELRTLLAVALVYVARMLGLFMVLPVMALYADTWTGASTLGIGLALGAYGLTQAIMQVPMGKWSDRIGRKPVITIGLVLFALGSILAAQATSIEMLIAARCLQGSGAVSAVLLALLSEHSAEQNRSKLMAILGISIGLSFGIAMVAGPILASTWGVAAIFWLCAGLAVVGMLAVWLVVPAEAKSVINQSPLLARPVWVEVTELRRLNFGIFTLHAVQMSLWMAVPLLLVREFSIAAEDHWQWYLLAVGGGFVLMAPFLQAFAKRNLYRTTLRAGVLSLMLAAALLALAADFRIFILGLLVFFWGFNMLEATLPALVSRWVDESQRGRVMGWYSAWQFFGTFTGGLAGGWVASQFGETGIFVLAFILLTLWLGYSVGMKRLPNIKSFVVRDLSPVALDQLRRSPGILAIRQFHEHNESFVRVDMDRVESGTREAYQLY